MGAPGGILQRIMDYATAIVLAGGSGTRFSSKENKSFALLAGEPVILHTLRTYESHPGIDRIVVVINAHCYERFCKLASEVNLTKMTDVVVGGKSRQESTMIGLLACLGHNPTKVLIQESVRPLTSPHVISETIKQLELYTATVAVSPFSDASMIFDEQHIITDIPRKAYTGGGQSPEGFLFKVIVDAHQRARKEGFFDVAENCALISHYRLGNIYAVQGNRMNIKITHPTDLQIAEIYLARMRADASASQ